jgi:TRAP-type uncharacterized transport system substrate-binding protein
MRTICVVVIAAALGLFGVGPLAFDSAVAQTARAMAAGEGAKVQDSNEWTVGIAGGLLEGTNIRFAAEMAKVLDDRPNLRVLPIVTYGALGNVEDLLYLKGIDITITQADVLDEYIKNRTIANIQNRLRYLCKFYVNEMHVYVRPEITKLEDLAGKKVSFNTVGSAANLTGGIVFDRLGIKVDKVFINNAIALEKMRTGEIAGVVHVTGKPTDLFAKFKPEPGFHFLPVPFSEQLRDFYVPTKLDSHDYPNLIPADQTVETIGVANVLAVYNWAPNTDRYRRVARFVEGFFGKFDQFQQPPFHPKWNEINLASTVPGWTRFQVAEDLLATMGRKSADPAGTAGKEGMSSDEKEALFNQFRGWMQKHNN